MRDRTPGVHDAPPPAPNLSPEQVWRQLGKASFLVLSQVNPAGEPRSSGVIYKTMGRRLYVATAPDSWKARHIAARPDVAVTVLERRGGILSLLEPIPPATVTFHATAIVHPAGSMELPPELLPELRPLLPQTGRTPAPSSRSSRRATS